MESEGSQRRILLKFERKATGQASYKLPGEERWRKEIKSYSCSSSYPQGQKGSAVKFSKQLLVRRGSGSEKSSKKLKVQEIMGFGQCLKGQKGRKGKVMSEICDPTNTQDLQVVKNVQMSASKGGQFFLERKSIISSIEINLPSPQRVFG